MAEPVKRRKYTESGSDPLLSLIEGIVDDYDDGMKNLIANDNDNDSVLSSVTEIVNDYDDAMKNVVSDKASDSDSELWSNSTDEYNELKLKPLENALSAEDFSDITKEFGDGQKFLSATADSDTYEPSTYGINILREKENDAKERLPVVDISANDYLYNKFRFIVTLNQYTYGFQSVSGFKIERRMETFSEGGVNDHLLSVTMPSDDTPTLTFRRGLLMHKTTVVADAAMAAAALIPIDLARRIAMTAAAGLSPQVTLEKGPAIGSIQVYDRRCKLRAMYTFFSLGMKNWSAEDLDASDGGLMYETVEIAHTGLTRVPLDLLKFNESDNAISSVSSESDFANNTALLKDIEAAWGKKDAISAAKREKSQAAWEKLQEKILAGSKEHWEKLDDISNKKADASAKNWEAFRETIPDSEKYWEKLDDISKEKADASAENWKAFREAIPDSEKYWENLDNVSKEKAAISRQALAEMRQELDSQIADSWQGLKETMDATQKIYAEWANKDGIKNALQDQKKVGDTWAQIEEQSKNKEIELQAHMEKLQEDVAKIADVWKEKEEKNKKAQERAAEFLENLRAELQALETAQ